MTVVSRLDPLGSSVMQILLDILKKDPVSLDHVQVFVIHDTEGRANTWIFIGPHHLAFSAATKGHKTQG